MKPESRQTCKAGLVWQRTWWLPCLGCTGDPSSPAVHQTRPLASCLKAATAATPNLSPPAPHPLSQHSSWLNSTHPSLLLSCYPSLRGRDVGEKG